MRHKKIGILAVVGLVLLMLGTVFVLYVQDGYPADDSAACAMVSDEAVTVIQNTDNLVFKPDEFSAGLIFYPGGKVEYTAYAPLMRALADDGILCILVKMPCNLAVLKPNAADGLTSQFPDITDWYIGGHSLGGAMAASYAAKHTDELKGLVLLGAYSTADLTQSGLRVYSSYGSEDGVLNREKYESNRKNLPQDTFELLLEGGCHAGFGNYGAQEGDGAPTLSAEEQQKQTADALSAWMKKND